MLQLGEAEGKAKGRPQPASRKPTAGTAPGERQLQGKRSPTFLMQESKGELVVCWVSAQSPCSCAPHSTAPALHPTPTLLPHSDENPGISGVEMVPALLGKPNPSPQEEASLQRMQKAPSPSSPSTQQHGAAGACV